MAATRKIDKISCNYDIVNLSKISLYAAIWSIFIGVSNSLFRRHLNEIRLFTGTT